MAKLEIDLTAYLGYNEFVEAVGNRRANLYEVEIGLKNIVKEDFEIRFRTAPSVESGGIVYGGEYWEPLSEVTLQRNPRRQGKQILKDTGRLYRSLLVDNQESYFRIQNDSFEYVTLVPYADSHQYGEPGRGVPRRRFMFIHDELSEKVALYLMTYFMKGREYMETEYVPEVEMQILEDEKAEKDKGKKKKTKKNDTKRQT
jgi:phage gpG-like protein